MMYYIVSVLFLLFVWCPCMAINVSVQYNGVLLPDIILQIGEGGGQLNRRRARGGLNPCARESQA